MFRNANSDSSCASTDNTCLEQMTTLRDVEEVNQRSGYYLS